jgi:transposase-like protein
MQLPRATRLVVPIARERMYLWRAVDHEGEVLDMLVQRRRDTRAALRLMRKLLKKQGSHPSRWSPTSSTPTLRPSDS